MSLLLSVETSVLNNLIHEPAPLLPSLILRYTQCRISYWADHQAHHDAIIPLDTVDIVQEAAMGNYALQIPMPVR